MFSIFVDAGKPALHTDESVFTVLPRKCGSFQKQKDNGQHSFLFRQGKVYPHGYAYKPYLSSVGYWMSFVFA